VVEGVRLNAGWDRDLDLLGVEGRTNGARWVRLDGEGMVEA
jgi:hypothetical protein